LADFRQLWFSRCRIFSSEVENPVKRSVQKQGVLVLKSIRSDLRLIEGRTFKNHDPLFALLEIVPQRTLLILDEVAFDEQPARVQLIGVCAPEEQQN
jgi:hypothetical protein